MDQDTLDKLASGEYSISPRSGRLRKRIRLKKQKKFFGKENFKELMNTMLWVILLAAFIVSLVMVFPELNLVSDKKKTNSTKTTK